MYIYISICIGEGIFICLYILIYIWAMCSVNYSTFLHIFLWAILFTRIVCNVICLHTIAWLSLAQDTPNTAAVTCSSSQLGLSNQRPEYSILSHALLWYSEVFSSHKVLKSQIILPLQIYEYWATSQLWSFPMISWYSNIYFCCQLSEETNAYLASLI